jgi:hypothetical protein
MLPAAVSIVVAVFSGLVAAELYQWVPRWTRTLLRAAAERIRDRVVRERLLEEWEASTLDLPGHFVPLRHAVSLFFAAPRMENEYRVDPDDPAFVEQVETIEEALRSFGGRLEVAPSAVEIQRRLGDILRDVLHGHREAELLIASAKASDELRHILVAFQSTETLHGFENSCGGPS